MRKKTYIWNIFLIVGIIIVIIAGIALYGIQKDYEAGQEDYHKLAQKAYQSSETGNEIPIDFESLQAINPDIIGWIWFENAGINYPIVQGKDNEIYLEMTADKQENKCGSIFMDYRCSSDFSDDHTIIYGHNMKDMSMFGSLKRYKTDDAFYEQNQSFVIYVPGKAYEYEIFSFYDVNSTDSVYHLNPSELLYKDMSRASYRDIKLIKERNNGKILTLSTCSEKGKRFIVNAVQIK